MTQESPRFFPKYVDNQAVLLFVLKWAITLFPPLIAGNSITFQNQNAASHMMKSACVHAEMHSYTKPTDVFR